MTFLYLTPLKLGLLIHCLVCLNLLVHLGFGVACELVVEQLAVVVWDSFGLSQQQLGIASEICIQQNPIGECIQ